MNAQRKQLTRQEAIWLYITRIRNPRKRDYARHYAIWLARPDRPEVAEPQPFHLTVMGAQAVRMRLNEIWSAA